MKILTGAEMRAVDTQAIAAGIPSLLLMENAGLRVVEFLAARFAPLTQHRIAIYCGKGNNGGDGLVIARQLLTRFAPARLYVILAGDPATTDAQTNLQAFRAVGGQTYPDLNTCRSAVGNAGVGYPPTLIIDALLGTGATGAPQGRIAELINEINGTIGARVIAVDVPSAGAVHAHATVTFETYKREHFDHSDLCGEVIVAPIGLPAAFINAPKHWLATSEPGHFRDLFTPRPRNSHKGTFGHVLVVGGSPGTTGAAIMSGTAALRAGAGLVTVSSATQQGFPPELMSIRPIDLGDTDAALQGKTVLAIGPGLGNTPESAALVRRLVTNAKVPVGGVVLDADALNVLGDTPVKGCVLTPHPGEMSRLIGRPTAEIQADRITIARQFATDRACTLVLKGSHTLIANPDGTVFLNTTGNPGMATGGAGDILTGLIAGLAAQFPTRIAEVVQAAVWIHGRAGDLGTQALGEKCLIATDLLHYLPQAIHEIV